MFGFGKGKSNKKVPEIDPDLFNNLRRAVRTLIKDRLASGEIPKPENGLYVLGCFVMFDWDSSNVCLYWSTEEQCRLRNEKLSASKWTDEEKHRLRPCYRWSPAEFGVEFICLDELESILTEYHISELDESIQDQTIEDFKARTQLAVIKALQDLVRTGAFGSPESRAKLTLLSGEMGNEEDIDETSLILSVRALNTPELANAFFGEWITISLTKDSVLMWTEKHLAKAKGTPFCQLLEQ